MTDDRRMVLRRWLSACPERVWAAWTEPAQLAAWWGPEGFTIETERFALEVGAEWVFDMAHATHGRFPNRIRWTAIEAPRLLTYDHTDADGTISFQARVDFEPSAGGTLVTLTSEFPSAEALRHVVEQFGALEGGRQHLSCLEAHLGRSPRVRVAGFSLSVDGFGAGPDQSLEHPLGRGGMAVHDWAFGTATFQAMHGTGGGGSTGVDDDYAARASLGIGAWILGRHMFGPDRGPWGEPAWEGWWGPNPPYHVPVFVLTHHPRPPLEMEGGTVFHFVTDGPAAALERAREAAGQADVRIGGGASTIRQYLRMGAIDSMHLVLSGAVLGRGESLLHGLDLVELGFGVAESVPGEKALHVVLERYSRRDG